MSHHIVRDGAKDILTIIVHNRVQKNVAKRGWKYQNMCDVIYERLQSDLSVNRNTQKLLVNWILRSFSTMSCRDEEIFANEWCSTFVIPFLIGRMISEAGHPRPEANIRAHGYTFGVIVRSTFKVVWKWYLLL